jgi:hypothetical protein
MPTIVDDWIAEIRDAIRHTPIDWDAIRSAKVSLRVEARTIEQKSAVETLMLASDRPAVQQAASAIERAFLEGMPGDDGWPRRF